MTHDTVVILCMVTGALSAIVSGIIIGGVLDKVGDEPIGYKLFYMFSTAGAVLATAIFGSFQLSLLGTIGACALAIFPGHFILLWLADVAEEVSKRRSEYSSTSETKSSWKSFFCILGFVSCALISASVCAKVGVIAGFAVATLGAPIITAGATGAVVDLFILGTVIFRGGLPYIGELLDQQAQRIASALRGGK